MNDKNTSESELVADRYLVLLAGALIVAYTLAPFEFSFSLLELKRRAKETFNIDPVEGYFRMAGHFAGFIVFGALLTSANEKYINRTGFGRFLLCSGLFCLVLEWFQLALPARHARVTDLVVNTLGLWLGSRSAVRWSWFREVRLNWLEQRRQPLIRVQLFIALLASSIWIGAGIFPLSRLSTLSWDKDFHLLIGWERDHDEGYWLGEIRSLKIYRRAFDAAQALLASERLAGSKANEAREMPDLLVGYDFTENARNAITPTGSLPSTGLSMEIPVTCKWLHDGSGLLLKEPSLLASRDQASDLTAAIVASGEFSVEAWIRPLNASQGWDGQARIISLSEGIWSRNFMLGQENSDMVFRVRNGINGPNGLRYALRVPGAFQDSLQHFVAIYDHGVSQIFRNGQLLNPIVDLRDPTVFVRLGNNAGAHAAAGILLVLTVALPMYSLCSFVQFNKLRHVVAILATFVTGSLPYVACCILVGGPWRLGLLLWLAIALSIVYPISFLYVRHSHFVVPVRL